MAIQIQNKSVKKQNKKPSYMIKQINIVRKRNKQFNKIGAVRQDILHNR